MDQQNSEQTFRERKTAQLAQERQEREPETPSEMSDPGNGIPDISPESADVSENYPDESGYAATSTDDDEGALQPDPDEGTPGEDELEESDDAAGNWEKRYKDLQSNTQDMRENFEQLRRDLASEIATVTQHRYKAEDEFNDILQQGRFIMDRIKGNADQYRNIDWSLVSPEDLPRVQQEAKQSFAIEQRFDSEYQNFGQRAKAEMEKLQQREAKIAQARLSRTIPNWGNEVYDSLRDFAVGMGMDVHAFNRETNPVFMEALHIAMQVKNAGSKVQTNVKRKGRPPVGRNAKQQASSPMSKFNSMKVEPNRRGSFAEKHKHRLAAERK